MKKPIKLSIIVVISIAMFSLVAPFVTSAVVFQANPQTCTIEITDPKPGAKVRSDALVSGTATIPPNGYLWILAHKRGLKGWWPQGGGEADIKKGEWEVLVKFGVRGENGAFEIAAVVVNKQTNEDLERWVERAPSEGYPPINFPNSIESCTTKSVTVDKVGD